MRRSPISSTWPPSGGAPRCRCPRSPAPPTRRSAAPAAAPRMRSRRRSGPGAPAHGAEQADAAHRRVWGERADASVVFGERSSNGGEPTLFGTLALRLWEPLLRAEDRCAGDALLPVAAFDVCGALPAGTTVLEASAGTGKTFTIASLAARYVAEGHGRAARADARHVRPRGHAGAARTGAGAAPHGGRTGAGATRSAAAPGRPTTSLALLAARRRRRGGCAAASGSPGPLAQFDAATIATTHQFCQQMLAGLGRGGRPRSPTRGSWRSIDDLLTEVVDDFYVRKYGAPGAGTPAFSRKEALAARPRRRRTTSRRGWSRATRRPAAPPRCGTASRARCAARWPAASASSASTPTTTCSPGSPRRWPIRRAAAARAAAGPVPGGAGRRVPGHRPGAVGHPAPRLPRPHHAGADRRPEAGDLRVPRRRRAQLPRCHRGRRPARHPGHELAQRRPAARRAGTGVRRRRAGQRADHRAPRRRGTRRSAGAGA